MSNREKLRDVKNKYRNVLEAIPNLTGIGLTNDSIKVNVTQLVDGTDYPIQLDGVSIIIEVVGNIKTQ
jgi:hypothetical protein